jgi:hypothetical protein
MADTNLAIHLDVLEGFASEDEDLPIAPSRKCCTLVK